MLEPLSFTARDVAIGAAWVLRVLATDTDSGVPTAPTLTGSVTLPDGTTAAVVFDSTPVSGVFRALVGIEDAGRHLARVTDGVDVVDFVAQGTEVVAESGMPQPDDLDGYLDEHSWTDDALEDVLTQEAAAQRRVCRVPAAYPADLRGALLRRCQRALAMRAVSLGMLQSEEAGPSVVPGNDPEVRRLERPWRRVGVG